MRTRLLLICGVLAGPLFTVAYLIEGATRADYDPLRHPVSSLALGEHGWTQMANFLVSGVLMLAFAFGLRLALRPGKGSIFGPLLVAIWGIGLLGAGIFVTDPVSGYPPGTPAMPETATSDGALHDLFSVFAFFSLPVACFVLSRRFFAQRRFGWASYSIASGVAFLGLFFLAGLGFSQTVGFVDYAGLLQRLCVTVGWAWLSLLGLDALASSRGGKPSAQAD
ncbi:MAG TPA: DUF998 domain-containing protein [Micromonosporaceae bacterium]|nr:DUF998 domain-containing protein [Micromonosporaceae bacterium]HCU51474.1 DUF998 domain-containing protein [Micromonosporaceae bacterium]